MRAGVQAIVRIIHEDAHRHGNERYSHIKNTIDSEIDIENAIRHEESEKEREVLRKHNNHEYMRRLEYQRSRLNRELLVYQHDLIDEIFALAVEKLREISTAEFSEMFKTAVKGLKGSFILYLGELSDGKLDGRALDEAVNTNARLKIALSSDKIPQKSGFLLMDDRVEYNHLFEDLVEDIKGERSAAIFKEIFGNSTDWMFT